MKSQKSVSLKKSAPTKVATKKAAKPASTATPTIGRTEAATMIKATKGKIFAATFIKKDGTERVLTGKLKVQKDVKGAKKVADVTQIGMIRVYDMVGHKWRMLNLQTTSKLKTGGKTYNVR